MSADREVSRLVLASTSPQRRAILDQLRIPFEVVAPTYEEHDAPGADPVELVRAHAVGKARSVHRDGDATLGVDTTVHVGRIVYGKAETQPRPWPCCASSPGGHMPCCPGCA